MKKIFKVEFVFDTGATYEDRICIIRADDKNDAVNQFIRWIVPQLGSDEWVKSSSIKVKEIDQETMVIYTDFHSYCHKY